MAQRMMACLAIAALAGAVSCTDAPLAPRNAVALTVTPATDSVTLTYICGNMFRVRNAAFEPRDVRWDIYGATPPDTGSLRLRGRDVGAAYVDYFVTARTNGTMRVFVGGVLKQTKANGNKAACAAPVDTSALGTISAAINTQRDLTLLPDSTIVSRTQVEVRFDPAAGSAAQRAFQREFGAQYIGAVSRLRIFRIRDLGSQTDSLQALIGRMKSFSGVQYAGFLPLLEEVRDDNARFPDDASGYRRSDYVGRNFRVWAATALRLPQAWACENGTYGAQIPRVAVLEQNFAGEALPDFAQSVSVTRFASWKTDTTIKGGKPSQTDIQFFQNHGAAVVSVLTAAGDNSTGVSGVMWKSDLRVFSMENTDRRRAAGARVFYESGLANVLAWHPKVLNLSSDFAVNSPTEDALQNSVEYTNAILRKLLDSLPDLLIVKSAGNDGLTSGAYQNVALKDRVALLTSLLQLRDSAQYKDRILIVGATNADHDRAGFSNGLSEVEIYAPGKDISLLRPNGSIVVDSGTSFATPAVAGIAGQLLAMDPSLAPRALKELLLQGARDSVENSSGVNTLPSRVGGIQDTVYEADAYGSLRVLSSRTGTPLCGARLAPWRDPATSIYSDSVGTQAIRYGAVNRELLPGFTASAQSLAAGGRLIAFAPATLQQFLNTMWATPTSAPDSLRRLFGERDTLRYRLIARASDAPGSDPSELQLQLRPTTGNWNVLAALNIAERRAFGQPSLSPAGDRVVVPFSTDSIPNDGTNLAILSASGATPIALAPAGVAPFGRSAWSPDGTRLIFYSFGFPASIGLQSAVVLVQFGGGTPTVRTLTTEPDRFPLRASWSDEGRRLTLLDVRLDAQGFTDCRRRDFSVSSTALTQLFTDSPDSATVCAATAANLDTPDDDYVKWLASSGGGGGDGGGGGGGGGGTATSFTRTRMPVSARASAGAVTSARDRLRARVTRGLNSNASRIPGAL